MAHRTNAEHRNRLVFLCHRSPPFRVICQVTVPAGITPAGPTAASETMRLCPGRGEVLLMACSLAPAVVPVRRPAAVCTPSPRRTSYPDAGFTPLEVPRPLRYTAMETG